MAQSFSFTEADVRALATDQSFERGYRYYQSSAVFDVIRRGDTITAKVQGSDYEPYKIQVVLEASDIGSTTCTCPYDWGGICKHIVATLLVLLHAEDEEIETKPEMADLLKGLTENQLRQVLLQVAEEGPALAEAIEREVQWLQEDPAATAAASTSSAPVTVDINAVRREIHKDFRLAGKGDPFEYGYYDEYAALTVYPTEILQPHLEKLPPLLDAGEVDTAEALIIAICEAFTDGLTALDEWVYEYNIDAFGDASLDLGTALAEVILSQELDSAQKEEWLATISAWEETLGYLDIAITAVEQGWSYPPLVAVLEGTITEKGAWEDEVPYFADHLALARLRILTRQERTEEYINLAAAEGQTSLYLNMLARTGSIERAVTEAKSYLAYPRAILSLSQVLLEKGEVEAAFDMAEHGLNLEQDAGKVELARWTRDQADAAGKQNLALEAAQVAFKSSPTLTEYQAVQQLAGSQWTAIKPTLLKSLRKSGWATNKIDIYLHEGLLREAMEVLDTPGFVSDADLQRVIKATRDAYPDWAIRKCKEKAEAIMDGGQSKVYDTAASWLAIAKDIYHQHQRDQEWRTYLEKLLQKHHRKYKLVPMLQNLR